MITTRELKEQRASIVTEMRTLTDEPKGDGGDLSAEQWAQIDKLKPRLESIEKRITVQGMIEAEERRMNGVVLTERGNDTFDKLCNEVMLTRAIASQIDRNAVDCGRELEYSKEASRRSGKTPRGIFVPLNALVLQKRVATTGGSAGNIVAESVLADQFIEALMPRTILGALGSRLLTGLRDDIAIPKLISGPDAEWLEDEGVSELKGGDHVFDQITATPHCVGLLTEWSRRVMLQSNPSLESLVRSDFTAKLALAIDKAGLAGSGSTGEPLGILTSSISTQELLGSPAAIDWETILSCIAQVLGASVRGGSFGWAMNAFVQKVLRATPKISGDGAAGYLMDSATTLADYPVQISSQMAGNPLSSPVVDGTLLFGDFSQVIVAFWGDSGADVLVNPYADSVFKKGNVMIRAFLDADVLIRHLEGFCKITGIPLA
jgi:HK97 family phage major capsid protein